MQKNFLETIIILNQNKIFSMKIFLVFIGGGFGSALRYLISRYLNSAEPAIPYGTFLVNILGSLLIGIILG